jgi:uncharacterized repeat protein (TIGR02543 family)
MKTKRLWVTTIASLFLLLTFMSSCKDENVEVIGDCPIIISTNPANLATNVPQDQIITATFNMGMNPQSFTQATFIVESGAKKKVESDKSIKAQEDPKDGALAKSKDRVLAKSIEIVPVTGTVSYSGVVATFTPSSPLSENTTYNCRILASVKDPMGNALPLDYVWSFSTGAIIVPTVISTDPVDLAINVALDKTISATFSVAMDPATITSSTFTLMDGVTPVPGVLNYSGTTLTFNPTDDFLVDKTYTATITTGVESEAGTPLAANYVWTFSTGSAVVPTVISTDPENLAINVALDKTLSASFSVTMDPATITTSTFTLMDGTNPIAGVVNATGTSATFNPTNNLELGKTYTATITTGVEDEAGTPLAANYVWTFTTGDAVAPTVISTDPVNLATNVPLDKTLSANFSVAMDPTTITTSTFTLMDGINPIAGVVSYTGTTATFNPTNDLEVSKTYTATITTGAENEEGIPLAANYVWTFTTGDAVPPTVTSTDPTDLATNVPLDKTLSANFSVAMDPTTITTSTFTLMDGINPIAGVVNYSGTTATFNPTNNLELGKTYTATITTGAEDEAGSPLAANYVWTFSTEDAVPPEVITTDPVDLAIDVALDKMISANFSIAMDPTTITSLTFTLMDGVNPIAGTVNYSGTTATFTPSNDLPGGVTLTATITTGAESEAGTPLADDYVWTFTTQFSLEVIAVNGTVLINPDQLGYNDGDIVILTATADDGYTFDSWSGDATGTDNPLSVTMDANKVITANFTENPPLGPGAVDLGSAGDFAILAKTGISTINTTDITGHIGVSPATSTAITGFSLTLDASGEFATSIYVDGNVYAADYAVPTPSYISTAISDQEAAFTAAMGLTTDVIVDEGAGDISGMTLAPGLYKWGTGLLITNQGVTLSGGPKDTWVFQIADDFTVANDATIVLAGGALAKNIFWITSTQALIGSNVEFYGNILAQTLISLTAGTTVTGRLLSQSAVTLDASIVTKPANK